MPCSPICTSWASSARRWNPVASTGSRSNAPTAASWHLFSWDLMAANLGALLGEGRTHVHEPAFDPNADSYVSWDYARGYTDATEAATRRH